MKKSMRIAAAALAAALIFTGCSGGAKKKETVNVKLTENGSYPIVEEPVTLSVLAPASTYVEDYSTNDFTKYYEKKTNVKIDWQIISGELAQKLNVIVASGNYPDVFLNCGIKKPAQAQYGRDGIIIPLNDLIEKHTVNIKKVLDENEYLKKQYTAPDGNIYGLGASSFAYHARTSNKLWVYEPWLEKSGMEMPETTEDFKNFLIKVRDGDFNGNGKKDEIPFLGLGTRDTVKFIMNSFTYMDDYMDFEFFVENGKVIYSPTTDGFKEGLKYIQDLYKEGLIAKDSFVIDRQQRTAIVENQEYPLVACCPALWYGQFTVNNGGTGRFAEFTAVPPLTGPSGRKATAMRQPLIDGQKFSISASCEYPEVAIRWVDRFFCEEGFLEAESGQEGVGWRKAKDGEKNIFGQPAKYVDLAGEFGETQNKHWVQLVPEHRKDEDEFAFASDDTTGQSLEARLYKESQKYEPYIEDKTLPDMFYDESVMNEYSTLKTNIYNETYRMVADMILGDKDIDSQWDGYISTLEKQGLKRYTEIQQETYDKYIKN